MHLWRYMVDRIIWAASGPVHRHGDDEPCDGYCRDQSPPRWREYH